MDENKENNSKEQLSQKGHTGLSSIPVFLLAIIAAFILIIILIINHGVASKESTVNYLLLLICFGLINCSGILAIIRREVPRLGLPSTKGLGAVIQGIMLVIVTSFVMLLLLIEMLK